MRDITLLGLKSDIILYFVHLCQSQNYLPIPCVQSAEEPVCQGEASEAQGPGWRLLRAEAAGGGEEARGGGQARDWGRRYGLNIDRVLMFPPPPDMTRRGVDAVFCDDNYDSGLWCWVTHNVTLSHHLQSPASALWE